MRRGFDLRGYKKALRARYRAIRKGYGPEEKAEKDRAIRQRLLSMPGFRSCATLLTYVSTPEEIDTREMIREALAAGKQVAVPYCIDGTRDMRFYLIRSLEELVPRTFGVLEPVADPNNLLTETRDALCVVPGIAFDRYGYRLGYGGGYYDRYLSHKFQGATVGLCYQDCSVRTLPHGRYDVRCGHIVTETELRRAWSPKPRAASRNGPHNPAADAVRHPSASKKNRPPRQQGL